MVYAEYDRHTGWSSVEGVPDDEDENGHKVHKRRLKNSFFPCKLAPNGVFFNC